MTEHVLICGAGPTGLGAAWRLEELRSTGASDLEWSLYEQAPVVGGMATTEAADGFLWDLGGHVLFSHYDEFDRLLDTVIDEWEQVVPVRGAWMWDRFIPYPVQRNLRHFPADVLDRVLADLDLDTGAETAAATGDAEDFEQFLRRQFGDELYDQFFLPLNRKMWTVDPSTMSFGWADQRSGSSSTNVPRIDVDEIRADIADGRDAPGWSSDTTIRYPAGGGTGRIWSEVQRRLPADRVHLGHEIERIDSKDNCARLADGSSVGFDHLISSMPLDTLLRRLSDQPELTQLADRFRPARVTLVGVGLSGQPGPELAEVCSLYVPETDLPFWRVTVLSNYSPTCVPTDSPHWSLLCEINTAAGAPAVERAVDVTLDGLERIGFIDRDQVVTTWERGLTHGYPVPHLGRDGDLDTIAGTLEPLGIYVRGRFGGWRYEVSNQDHAFMQGVEAVDRICSGTPEVTYVNPSVINESVTPPERTR